MKETIAVLSIAGSDSCGGAGIQADIKTISALGLYACTAITAITAQNTQGVRGIQAVEDKILAQQMETVLEDFDIQAIKIGMVYTVENVLAIKDILTRKNFQGSIVLDPVLVATSGSHLAKRELLPCMKEELFPLATLITPNLQEAEAITGMKVQDIPSMQQAGRQIIDQTHAQNILIKGGHLEQDLMSDVLITKDDCKVFSLKKIQTNNTHGTGCSLSSALACFLAQGYEISEAVKLAKEYVNNALCYAKDLQLGKGNGSLNHLFDPKKLIIK